MRVLEWVQDSCQATKLIGHYLHSYVSTLRLVRLGFDILRCVFLSLLFQVSFGSFFGSPFWCWGYVSFSILATFSIEILSWDTDETTLTSLTCYVRPKKWSLTDMLQPFIPIKQNESDVTQLSVLVKSKQTAKIKKWKKWKILKSSLEYFKIFVRQWLNIGQWND